MCPHCYGSGIDESGLVCDCVYGWATKEEPIEPSWKVKGIIFVVLILGKLIYELLTQN